MILPGVPCFPPFLGAAEPLAGSYCEELPDPTHNWPKHQPNEAVSTTATHGHIFLDVPQIPESLAAGMSLLLSPPRT